MIFFIPIKWLKSLHVKFNETTPNVPLMFQLFTFLCVSPFWDTWLNISRISICEIFNQVSKKGLAQRSFPTYELTYRDMRSSTFFIFYLHYHNFASPDKLHLRGAYRFFKNINTVKLTKNFGICV